MIIKFEDYEKIQEKIDSEGLESIKESLSSTDYKAFKTINEFDPITGGAVFSLLGGEAILAWAAGLWSASKILNFLSKAIPGGALRKIDKLMSKYSELQVQKVNTYEEFINKSQKAIESLKKGSKDEISQDIIELRKNINRQEKYLLDKYDNEVIPIKKEIEKIRKENANNERVIDYIDEKKRIIDKELIESMGKALEKSTGIIWAEEEARERKENLEEEAEKLDKEEKEAEEKYKNAVPEEEAEEEIDKNKLEKIAPGQTWERTNLKGEKEKIKVVGEVNKEENTVVVEKDGKKYKVKAMSLDNFISDDGDTGEVDLNDPDILTDKGEEEINTDEVVNKAEEEAEKEKIPVEEEIEKGMNKWFDDAKEDIERKLGESKDYSAGDTVRYTRENGQKNTAKVSKDQSEMSDDMIKLHTKKNTNGFGVKKEKILGKTISIDQESYELLKKDLINLYGKLVFYYKEIEGDNKGLTKNLKFSLVSFASKLYEFKKAGGILDRELNEEELQKQFNEYEK